MQILLNICDEYSKKRAMEFNIEKYNYIIITVFRSNKYNDTSFILNGLPLSFSNNIK